MKNNYEVRGDITVIFITCRGETLETIIDTDDLEKVLSFNTRWWGHYDKRRDEIYVEGEIREDGKRIGLKLHRVITDANKGYVVDHVDHNSLNNTKDNLRVVTQSVNMQNRKGAQKNSKSGIRGVSWHKPNKTWKAYITINGEYITLGYFKDKEDAVSEVMKARKENYEIAGGN